VQAQARAAAAGRVDDGPTLLALPVEDDQAIPGLQAQNVDDVVRAPCVEAQAIPGEVGSDEQARRGGNHAGHQRLQRDWVRAIGRRISGAPYPSSMQVTLAVHPRAVIINPRSGWLKGVDRVPSPNRDPRPRGCKPDLIVVHGISLPPAEFGGAWIDRFFTNTLPADAHDYFATIAYMRVSAHVLIRRDGSLTQYVPFKDRAWHAGESLYCGRAACNDFSVGIELEGADDVPYEAAQYRALAALVRALKRAYPSLREAEVVGHSDIAPGRKTDPGPAFDWRRLRRELTAEETA
jgi:AmpD protein